MLQSQKTALSIAAQQDQATLSKGQKAFNKLIQQIEKKRALLAAWEEVIPAFRKKYAEQLQPLIDSSAELQVQLVHALDRAMALKGLTKTERGFMAGLITDLAADLLSERDDAELKAIYNRHSGSDLDEEEAAGRMGMKSMLEGMLGMKLDDDLDWDSPEEVLQRVQAQMQEQQAQDEAKREERDAKRKKSAKQLAKEERLQAEEQQTSLSIREIYRKLASALHPDRETDLQERERKNALMQRVNQAYAEKNLLQLLELQLEIEHIDQDALNNISEVRLKHYNKILKEQLFELEQSIDETESLFCMQFGISPFERINPGNITKQLDVDIAVTRNSMRTQQNDLLVFEDIKKLKAWIKKIRKEARQQDDLEDWSF